MAKKYDNAADGWTPDDDPTDDELLSDSDGILDTLFLDEDGEISWGKMIVYVIIGMVIAIILNWDTIKEERSISSLETTTETSNTL